MKNPIALIAAGITSLALLLTGVASAYIISEGNVGVVKSWGKAVGQEAPAGLKFKNPISTQIVEFDVRERRLAADMAAATDNQLPIQAIVTMSWRLDPTRVLEVFKEYGSPENFEANILRPRLLQASKAGLSKFQASDLIRDRATAANTILTNLQKALEPYPAILASLQIEQVVLPPRYLDAVMDKEREREAAAKEGYILERQKLTAQQKVQTAEAERDATKAQADGEAYKRVTEAEAEAQAIKAKGEAEADAIRAKQQALANNPLVIEYEKARTWNGQLPQTVLGDGTNMLMSLK